jgi:hypothetical protein
MYQLTWRISWKILSLCTRSHGVYPGRSCHYVLAHMAYIMEYLVTMYQLTWRISWKILSLCTSSHGVYPGRFCHYVPAHTAYILEDLVTMCQLTWRISWKILTSFNSISKWNDNKHTVYEQFVLFMNSIISTSKTNVVLACIHRWQLHIRSSAMQHGSEVRRK